MAYVTKYKLKRVLGDIEGNLIDDPFRIYISGKYYYLSDREIHRLTIYFRFTQNPKKFIEGHFLKWKDAKINAVEVQPAYHTSETCDALNKRFDNVVLPSKIQSDDKLLHEAREIAKREGLYSFGEKNEEELNRFVRVCFEEMNQNHKDLDVKIKDFKVVHNKQNSGSREFKNLTLQQIKERLEKLIKKSNEYFGFNEKRQLVLPNNFFNLPYSCDKSIRRHNRLQVLENYRNYLYLIANEKKVKNNYTDFCSDDEVIKIAQEIRDKFTTPSVSTIEAELLKNTDKKEFDKTVLEVLGFKPCRRCGKGLTLSQDEEKYIVKYRIR